MFTFSSEKHSINDDKPIDVTESGIVTSTNDIQLRKDDAPIDVIEEGIIILFNFLQFLKHFSPISIPGSDNKSLMILI